MKRVAAGTQPIQFAIAFVRTYADVEMAASLLLPKAVGDATVWFAYPKGSSKRYLCEFNRAISKSSLTITLRASLRKFPGSIHWHLKRGREAGTLEVTFWPQ